MKMIGPSRKSGRKVNPRREFYRLKYDLYPDHNRTHQKLLANCVQLDACKDEESIRILLGVKVSEMSTAARTYPYGRTRRDDARQPFKEKEFAQLTADILERITGDRCEVISRGPAWHMILRVCGDKAGRG